MGWEQLAKVGDKVRPIPAWNRSERAPRHLPEVCEILEVVHTPSQTGICFVVKFQNGRQTCLSSGWFTQITTSDD